MNKPGIVLLVFGLFAIVGAAVLSFAGGNPPAADSGSTTGMVKIPGGAFMMGCSPGDSECSEDEKPAHKVKVKSFWMDAKEVTQTQYKPLMGGNPNVFFADCIDCPVDSVTWDEAAGYCAKVGKRLPTEAEWEYAARGGTTGARYGEVDAIAWHKRNAGEKTHPVGQKQPNKYGLYDMLGNVREWCADWYDEKYYAHSPADNPQGPLSGKTRVIRGGCWAESTTGARASNRSGRSPGPRFDFYTGDVGIRCVRD